MTRPKQHPPKLRKDRSSNLSVESVSQLADPLIGAVHPKQFPKGSLYVEYVTTETLKAHSRNARTHSAHQIKKIARSIREFGFVNPILVTSSGDIIAGHGRWQAAQKLGLATVPVIKIDHLSPLQIRALVIADNKIASQAGWDENILAQELLELSLNLDIDVSLTGFEVPEMDILIEGLGAAATAMSRQGSDPDDAIGALGPAVTRLGDTWILGRHRLCCGDALNAAILDGLMKVDKAAAVLIDPPYNVRVDGHVAGLGATRHREFAMASGEMTSEQFVTFLKKIFRNLARSSRSGSVHYIFIDWRHARELLEAGKEVYAALLNLCVWVKDNGGMGSFYRSQHELIFVFRNGDGPHINNIQLGKFGRNRTNAWHYAGVNAFARQTEEGRLGLLHPTVKPVSMIADAILDCTARGDIVLDTFLGSGTTLIAAERVGRICYGVEIDPLYVDIAVRRWQLYSGDFAVHAVTGLRFDGLALKSESDDV